jgi:hypothetical protein
MPRYYDLLGAVGGRLPVTDSNGHGIGDIDYPFQDKIIDGHQLRAHLFGAQNNKLQHGLCLFAGRAVGIKEVHDDIWLVSFVDYDLGFFDLDTRVLERFDNPFPLNVPPVSSQPPGRAWLLPLPLPAFDFVAVLTRKQWLALAVQSPARSSPFITAIEIVSL